MRRNLPESQSNALRIESAVTEGLKFMDFSESINEEKLQSVKELFRTLETFFSGSIKPIKYESDVLGDDFYFKTIENYSEQGISRQMVLRHTLSLLTEKQRKIIAKNGLRTLFDFLWIASGQKTQFLLQGILQGCGEHYLTLLFQENPLFLRDQERDPSDILAADLAPFYAELYKKRQFIDGEFSKHPDITLFLQQHPSAAPFLRLRFQRALDEEQSVNESLGATLELVKKMSKETGVSLDPQYAPSIGIETEINFGTPMPRDKKDYFLTAVFGIPDSYDEQWEFAIPPSDSRMQARFIQELIRGNWLDSENLQGNEYTMHLNIGIPEDVELSAQDAGFLSYALVATYADEKRLLEGEYDIFFKLKIDGRHSADGDTVDTIDSTHYKGRLEVRALSLMEKTLYRTIFDSSLLAAACFAHTKEERDEKEEALAELWSDFQTSVMPLFKKIGLNTDFSSSSIWRGDLAPLILSIQDDVKKHLRILTRKAAQIVSDPAHEEQQALAA
jgi:hypothetical protein